MVKRRGTRAGKCATKKCLRVQLYHFGGSSTSGGTPQVRPFSSFLVKRYHKMLSVGSWSPSRTHGKIEECRGKRLFPSPLKRLVECIHKDVVSFRQKTTERPAGENREAGGFCFSFLEANGKFTQGWADFERKGGKLT